MVVVVVAAVEVNLQELQVDWEEEELVEIVPLI
jgi:hypothetical protein